MWKARAEDLTGHISTPEQNMLPMSRFFSIYNNNLTRKASKTTTTTTSPTKQYNNQRLGALVNISKESKIKGKCIVRVEVSCRYARLLKLIRKIGKLLSNVQR